MSARSNAFQFVARDIVGSVLFFPVWWYTKGLAYQARAFARRVRSTFRTLGLRILVEHFTEPMYGDYSKSGRAISLVMRTLQLGVYSVIMFIALILFVALFLIYLILPVLVTYEIVLHVSALV